MTKEERVEKLHQRVEQRTQEKRQREKAVLSMSSCLLCLGLFVLIASGGAHHDLMPDTYTGSIMMFENAGGYVLTALLAFMLGVVVTVLVKNYKKPDDGKEE
ncbi:MAG: hypothetical protein K6E18_04765 [Lachnospiraceae bacterium]|nr:hypothetical protein [Lachnospiraceae bacterium]